MAARSALLSASRSVAPVRAALFAYPYRPAVLLSCRPAVRLLVLIALESKRKRTEKCVKSPNTNVPLKGHSLARLRTAVGEWAGMGQSLGERWLNRYTQIEWDS